MQENTQKFIWKEGIKKMLNHSVLLGRIGHELELKTTSNGTEVVSFKLAVQRNYNKDITDWISVVAWKGTATTITKHFQKGDLICIEGSIQTRDYDDKDGKKVYITEVVADKVHFVTSKREANTNNGQAVQSEEPINTDEFIPVDDVTLPF